MRSNRQTGFSANSLSRVVATLSLVFVTSVACAADMPIAITNVTLIDGTGHTPRSATTVVIENGRIKSIGGAGIVPQNATRIDGSGRFLVPGFIDSNVHGTVYGNPNRRDTSVKYADRNEELALEFAQRELKAGVTTIRDSYGVLPPLLKVRDGIAKGELIGSRMQVAGNILGWGGPFSLTYSLTKESDLSLFQEQWNDALAQGMGEELLDMTPDELRVAIDAYLDRGVDFLKYGGTSHFMTPSLIGFSPRQQKVIVDEAHKRGKHAETHATSSEALRIAVEAGIDLIQHPELMSRDDPDDLIALIIQRNPLCAMRSNMVTGELRKRQIAKRAEAESRVAKLPPAATIAERHRRAELLDDNAEVQRRNAERLVKAGCRVTIATDSYLGDAPEFRRAPKTPEQEPGEGSLLAIEGLVELGMTPMQALVAATRNGGAATGIGDLGTIEPDKIADVLLLDADPLVDIHNIRKLDKVIANGRVIDIAKLPEHPLFVVPSLPPTP